jgi:hypothetical protein
MDRTARREKAALVKQAISAMKSSLETATGSRRDELLHDLRVAQGDFDALLDFDTYPDEFFGDSLFDSAPPMGGGELIPLDDDFGDLLPPSPVDEIETLPPMGGPDAMIESMYGGGGMGGAGPGPQAGGDEMFADEHCGHDMWTATNREHVSYILDKVADLTASIEQYEHRAAVANKKASGSKGARGAVAALMKKLASVVHNSDFSKEATGKALDQVGVEVMKLHKQLGLSS